MKKQGLICQIMFIKGSYENLQKIYPVTAALGRIRTYDTTISR